MKPATITLNADRIGPITIQDLVAFAAAQGCIVAIHMTRVSGPPPPSPHAIENMIQDGRNARVARALGRGFDEP